MSSLTLVNLSSLIDDANCYELVRRHRWPEGVRRPHCEAPRWLDMGMTHPAASAMLSVQAVPEPFR
jgi:hypothetical protein